MHVGGRASRGRGSRRVALAVAVGVGCLASGCTPRERPALHDDEPPADECTPIRREPAPLPVITTLVTREHEVTVYASDDGLRFSVALADGSVLGRMLTRDEFAQGFPALQRRFDATFAGDATWLDASLDGSRTPTSELDADAHDRPRTPPSSDAALSGSRPR